MKKYLFNILIAIDQLIAVMFAPILNFVFKGTHKFGDPDETISSVFGKNVRENQCQLCKFFCFFLNLVDKNHCEKSIEEDEGIR